jgi:hypothetical protein
MRQHKNEKAANMKLTVLRAVRWLLTALFALLAAAFVGLTVYAVLQFGLWWPRLIGAGELAGQLLAAGTMLPFLLVFTKLNWSRPMGWLAARFSSLITPLDNRIDALRSGD